MSELFEKTIGSAGALGVFCLGTIWVVEVQLDYKLLATGIVALIVCLIVAMLLLKRWRLQKTRRAQLYSHRNGGPPPGGSTSRASSANTDPG